jgi:hypothetical protein
MQVVGAGWTFANDFSVDEPPELPLENFGQRARYARATRVNSAEVAHGPSHALNFGKVRSHNQGIGGLTDKHKLRRSQINAAARAASAAAFHQSLRRQLHALLGCGPATCFAIRRHTAQPARIRKLRRTGQVSKALRRRARAKATDHGQSRPRTARAHGPIARTGRSWLVGVTPRDMARARRPARPNAATKKLRHSSHGVVDQPNGQA